jgi:hypothetical protein
MKIVALIAIAVAMAPRVADAVPIACESMGQIKLSNGAVLSAESVSAGAFTAPTATNAAAAAAFKSLPAFCRVTLKLAPSADSDVRVEVWLPLSGWNHKIQAAGNGGWAGRCRIRHWPLPSGQVMPLREPTPVTSAATPISSAGIPRSSSTSRIARSTR